METTLSTAYLFAGAPVAAYGVALALAAGQNPVERALRAFPRSLLAAIVFFGGAAAWFLHMVQTLGEADLAGFPRNLLLGVFGATALLAFRFLRDLLAVRGLGILLLLSARVLLDAGYMQQPHNLLLSSTAYLFVVLGILWGVSPHRFRDWQDWALTTRLRTRIVGGLLAALGLGNLVAGILTR
jgi:hypothetical protein